MNFDSWPQTGDVLEAFSQEIAELGGVVTESFDDGKRLYARSTLPDLREVTKGDSLKGGVAIRVTDADIRVHPYTFRVVCSNGAIRAEAIQTCVLERDSVIGAPLTLFCNAVRDCAHPSAFDHSLREMRSAMEAEADFVFGLLHQLANMPNLDVTHVLGTVLRQFETEGDRSAFGMMNAITATARGTRDPEARWRLEALGGGVGALLKSAKVVPIQAAKPIANRPADIVA